MSIVNAQPSTNFNAVVLNLCRAVESELAAGLGSIEGLEFLAELTALGNKAHRLREFTIGSSLKQRL